MFGLFKPKLSPATCAITDKGDRDENQDASLCLEYGSAACYLVADGMGGHKGGKLASNEFCAAISKLFPDCLDRLQTEAEETIKQLINRAREEMCARITRLGTELSPHTTAVLAILNHNVLYVAHIGDSRAYLIQKGKISWQSRDHSVAQLMLEQGEMAPDEVAHDGSQSILFRSIECHKKHSPSMNEFNNIQPGDCLVLCSDGFWCYSSDADLLSLAVSAKPHNRLKKLVHKTRRAAKGHADNITVVFVRF